MVTKVNTVTPLSTPGPNRSMSPTVYAASAQTFAAEITNFVPALNLRIGELNTLATELQALSGMSMLYTFSTTTTDSDPGPGTLRLDAATQNTSSVARIDALDVNGADMTAFLTSFGSGTSGIKGMLRVAHRDTPTTKFLLMAVSAVAVPSGYRNVSASVVAFSAANPFANGDPLVVTFTRTGDGGGISPADAQNQAYTTGTTGGTSTAYTLTPTTAIGGYSAGQSFFVTFHAASGAAPTLTISAVGTPPNLVKELPDGTYANIAAGDIPINHRSRVTLISTAQALVERLPAAAGGNGSVITFSTGATAIGDAVTRYIGANGVTTGSETDCYTRVPCAGVLKGLFTQTPGNSAGNRVYTLRVNGVDTAITCTATGAATQSANTANSVAVNAGDRIAVKLVTSGSSDSTTHNASTLFTPTA